MPTGKHRQKRLGVLNRLLFIRYSNAWEKLRENKRDNLVGIVIRVLFAS